MPYILQLVMPILLICFASGTAIAQNVNSSDIYAQVAEEVARQQQAPQPANAALEIILGTLLAISFAALPAVIVRFGFKKKPLRRVSSNWISAVVCVIGAFIFAALKAEAGGPNPRLSPLWIGLFFLSRWILQFSNSTLSSEAPIKGEKTVIIATIRTWGRKGKTLLQQYRSQLRLMLVWVGFVIFRTSDHYEILGIDFSSWEEDSFFINLLCGPILFASYYAAKRHFLNRVSRS